MSNGTLFLIIVVVGFLYFGTQFGSSRGPDSVKKDFINLGLLICVGVFLWILWASKGQMIPGGH